MEVTFSVECLERSRVVRYKTLCSYSCTQFIKMRFLIITADERSDEPEVSVKPREDRHYIEDDDVSRRRGMGSPF